MNINQCMVFRKTAALPPVVLTSTRHEGATMEQTSPSEVAGRIKMHYK